MRNRLATRTVGTYGHQGSAVTPVTGSSRRASVVGGGIAGLAVAGGLRQRGWSVEVWERSTKQAGTGTALGMWPSAMDALERLGLAEEIRAAGVRSSSGVILRSDGRPIVTLTGRDVVLVSRRRLLAALATLVPEEIVRRDDAPDVAAVDDADVVIGADGIHSTTRDSAWPAYARPRPLGTVAFRGVVPGPAPRVSETWGPGRLFGITPQDDRTTNWFACSRAELTGDADEPVVGRLRRLYGGWHREVTDVLERLDGTVVDRRRLLDLPPLASYVRGRTVLIGDAAHAMAPNLGRGACESLVDAVALAEALGEEPSVAVALERYDRVRRKPADRIRAASRVLNRLSTATRGVPLRDVVVSAVGRAARPPSRRGAAAGMAAR